MRRTEHSTPTTIDPTDMVDPDVDDRDLLEAEARERWGDEWRIDATYWADGDCDFRAIHVEPTNDPTIQIHSRLFVGADGDVYHDRVRVAREEIIDVIERDARPDGATSEFIHDEE